MFNENSYFAKTLFCLAGPRSFSFFFFFFFQSRSFQVIAMKPLDFSQNLFEKSFTDFFSKLEPHDFDVPTKNFYPKTSISKRFVLKFCLNLPFCYLYTCLHESRKESICYISQPKLKIQVKTSLLA